MSERWTILQKELLEALGDFPVPPSFRMEILESHRLETGWRYKVEYTIEEANELFNTPADKVRAYLLTPDHEKDQKLPAIVAVHQDGPNTHLGKLEPAGLSGAKDQHYGLELFERGYVVICPDRMGHAERRRIPEPETSETDHNRDNLAYGHWVGQLTLLGRTRAGKETYDLMRATDVLCSLDYVDPERIGAIGHSAGGNALVYFMFVDRRIKVGISSCGFFEILDFYNENAPMKRVATFAIPGLAKIGKSADYLALLAPRPFLMTRGLWEWGKKDKWESYSKKHVEETKAIENHARQRYSELNVEDNLRVIYFDEQGGDHAFPQKVREEAYQWLDRFLRPSPKAEKP